ncbi:helix-turn-helix domain-containing protein [Catenulispora pinisilvae]|uniref:helix-turn-helix domain-containing protein n=1 Tax=Catenulispora pinisilvae TaxID=2705253 RepID=UPI0018921F46|nr:helix-turn-helix domain-containing protein [Catenulispora pinisilvae]
MSADETVPEGGPTLRVRLDSLSDGLSARLTGHDEQMVRLLAEQEEAFPPLMVQWPSRRVIDGAHRLRAARLRGDVSIAVRYYECDNAEAFILAVRANVRHGIPLSLRERKVAAARIIRLRIQWSNSRIAKITGLSDKTVAAVRVGLGDTLGEIGGYPYDGRIGLDGRVRPVDAPARRLEVARLIAQNPGASLRAIAALAGVSPETVRAVRRAGTPAEPSGAEPRESNASGPDPRLCHRRLVADPALRFTDRGRLLLRVLGSYPLLEQQPETLVECVPVHDLTLFRHLALAASERWQALASQAALREAESGADAATGEDTSAA